MNFVVKSGVDLQSQLKPGRRECGCQARQHTLVRNCLNCGRIVCQQEGSGPCFTCGSLVCSREEREILNAKTKQSSELLLKLMGTAREKFVAPTVRVPPKRHEAAELYRDKMLAADANEERTKVNDLESDYYSLEHSPYLDEVEREAIIRRKAELQKVDAQNKRKFVVDLDIANKRIEEKTQASVQTADDPVIQSILRNSKLRAGQPCLNPDYLPPEAAPFAKTFVPNYDDPTIRKVAPRRMQGKRYNCVSLNPRLVDDILEKKKFYIPWLNNLTLRGTLLVASGTNGEGAGVEDTSCEIVGRVQVEDCITAEEFKEELPKEKNDPASPYALIVRAPEAFECGIPCPHFQKDGVFEIDQTTAELVEKSIVGDPSYTVDSYTTLTL